MRRFWNWVTDQKANTVRKWQSTVLNTDKYQEGSLRPIGGSDDELDREQRRRSSTQEDHNDNDDAGPSALTENFDKFDYQPIDFEEFFDEASIAIETALVSILCFAVLLI